MENEPPLSPRSAHSSPRTPSSLSSSTVSSFLFTSSTSGVFSDDSATHDLSFSDFERSNRTSHTSDTDSEFFIPIQFELPQINEIQEAPVAPEAPEPQSSAHSDQNSVVCRLQEQLLDTQKSYLSLTSELTLLKFKLRQVLGADEAERLAMLEQLRPLVFTGDEEVVSAKSNEVVEEAVSERHEARQEQFGLIRQLREQLSNLASVSQQQYQMPSELVEERNNIQSAKEALLKRINERLLAKDREQARAQAQADDDDDSD